jgi:hypothetical protein
MKALNITSGVKAELDMAGYRHTAVPRLLKNVSIG